MAEGLDKMAYGSEITSGPNSQRGPGRPRSLPIGTEEWQCQGCGTRLFTHVVLSEPPRCTRHTGGAKAMKLVRTITE